jgi:hypothetical protein
VPHDGKQPQHPPRVHAEAGVTESAALGAPLPCTNASNSERGEDSSDTAKSHTHTHTHASYVPTQFQSHQHDSATGSAAPAKESGEGSGSPHNFTLACFPFAHSLCCLERFGLGLLDYAAINTTLFNINSTTSANASLSSNTSTFIHNLCEALFAAEATNTSAGQTGGNITVAANTTESLFRCLLGTPRSLVNWSLLIFALPDLFRLRMGHWEQRVSWLADRVTRFFRGLLLESPHDDDDEPPPDQAAPLPKPGKSGKAAKVL